MGDRLAGTLLEADQVVPGVPMTDAATGRPVRAWDFRHRRALVLAFLHADCAACEAYGRDLAAVREDLSGAGAEARAVLPAGTSGDGEGALPALIDETGRAVRRFLEAPEAVPLVLLIDRFGAAWRSYPSPGHDFPSTDEVVASLWHVATMCPECGVSTW